MTTPLSWINEDAIRFGPETTCIELDRSNRVIGITNSKTESGGTTVYNEVLLGALTAGAGLELVNTYNTKASIYTEDYTSKLDLFASNNSAFHLSVGNTAASFDFGINTGSSIYLPLEASISTSSVSIILSAENQKDDENNGVHLEIDNTGIYMPLLWKTSATNSTKIQNTVYPIELYDAQFLSITDSSNVSTSGSRNNMLAKTVPSTYAVRSALAAVIPAPFSFVAKTDANNNDFFGIQFTDPANSDTTKTLWFNFATVDGNNVGLGEWENATTRKSTTP